MRRFLGGVKNGFRARPHRNVALESRNVEFAISCGLVESRSTEPIPTGAAGPIVLTIPARHSGRAESLSLLL